MLHTQTTQVVTHTTNVYVDAAAYLATMSVVLLVYCRGLLRVKRRVYRLGTTNVNTFSLR